MNGQWETHHAEKVPGDEEGEGPTDASTVGVRVETNRVRATRINNGARSTMVRTNETSSRNDSLVVHVPIPSLSVHLLSMVDNNSNFGTHPVVMKANITKAFGIDE